MNLKAFTRKQHSLKAFATLVSVSLQKQSQSQSYSMPLPLRGFISL